MSIVNMDAESTISAMVDAMLPRFSDANLGLHMEINLSFEDHGFGDDGNILERKKKSVRRIVHFLFQRPSNYTKVFIWESLDKKNYSPTHVKSEWFMASDHDSCWRDAVGSKLTDIYFDSHKQFEGRMKSGKSFRPIDLSQYITLYGSPSYVHLDVFNQKDKQADRFSDEGRIWDIQFHTINLWDVEAIKSPDTKWMGNSGLLIKGSKTHNDYLNRIEAYRKNNP